MANKELSRAASQITLLASLITSSVDVINAEYGAAGLPAPSLDASSPVESDIVDFESSRKISRANKIIEAACAQLCASVSRPEYTVLVKTLGFEESACLRVASTAGIAGLLLGKPEGVHITELSASSGINADKLGRVLRLLATRHVFQEVSPNVFANNKLSLTLATSEATNDIIKLSTRETFTSATYLSDFLQGTDSTSEIKSPFHIAYGAPMMDYHNTPEGKKTVAGFMKGVAGWGEVARKSELIRAFPWAKHFSGERTTTVCDIGGGDGHIMLMLLRAYASYPFRVIVQDRPAFLDLGRQLWGRDYPEGIQEKRVDFVPLDFFTEAPVEGCEIYYKAKIRHCLHNWPDDECIIILKNIAKVMKAENILLVHETVLRHAASSLTVAGDDVAPAPLLPNFGAACYRDYAGDINMLNLLDAKDRTLEEFISLGSKSGFAFERIWDAEDTSLVEFKLA
ncbi:hypothetical protein EW145_g7114 [Phellinidium pouzarii]|uniref:Uncharacterized protein n=1 Tax=Phellinidium pouzarii TaxID=167371 RepID=A0A4S4KNV0_9AGAM|nr:hypothetical protein EW145_g7114 [Phellinidium pouzarii]